MPKATVLQSNFKGGELSPFAQGRVESPRYRTMISPSLNWLPLSTGALTRRPGSKYVGAIGNQAAAVRLLPFFEGYGLQSIVEMAAGYFQFWSNEVLVTPDHVTFVNLYGQNDLSAVRFLQIGPCMLVFHPSYPTLVLRDATGVGYPTTETAFSFFDGPYLNSNWNALSHLFNSTTTLALAATSGNTTLTANNATGINGGSGFLSSDVGRVFRINTGVLTGTTGTVSWTWGKITGITSNVIANVTILGQNALNTTATGDWALGLFSNTTGWPAWGALHEGRIFVGGSTANPTRIDGSSNALDFSTALALATPGAYFTPTNPDGSVSNSNAVSYTLLAANTQRLLWGIPDERGLLCGSGVHEWTVRPDTLSAGLTPTNVNAKIVGSYGSNPNVRPVQIGKSVIFVQKYATKLRELIFDLYTNGYKSPDRTQLANHITAGGGIVDMAVSREPLSTLWCARADGNLVAMTHEEEEDGTITTGWSTHQLGGSAVVETVACIPSSDNTTDEVYVVAKRTINGSTARYIEKITAPWNPNSALISTGQNHLDSWGSALLSPSNNPTPLVVSALAGMTIGILAAGAPLGNFVADGTGRITMPYAASPTVWGLPYNSDLQLLRPEAGASDGTALGKLRRIHRVALLLLSAGSFSYGNSFSNLTYYDQRKTTDPISTAVPLFSGVLQLSLDMDTDYDNLFCFRVSDPTPCTILATTLFLETQDAQ